MVEQEHQNSSCPPRPLRRADLPVDTIELAEYLIGKTLIHCLPGGMLRGRIVETEAYPVGDAAGHAFPGKTLRNSSLFLPPGHAYVYLVYGSSLMLNVTSEHRGIGAGVLLRALEPLQGLELMQRLRGTKRLLELTRGPGRLAQAMAIKLSDDGHDLCKPGRLWLADAVGKIGIVSQSERIGLGRNVDPPWRFFERDNPYVSGPRNFH